MLHGIIWFIPLVGIPFEALFDEVEENLVVALENLVQGLGSDLPRLAPGIYHLLGGDFFVDGVDVEEQICPGAPQQQLCRGLALHLHHARHLFSLRLAWENRNTGVELAYDTTETPHVDFHIVRNAQDNLWSAIESALNIGVNPLVVET